MATPHEKAFADIEALIGAALDRATDLHKRAEADASEAGANVTKTESQRWNSLAVDAAFGLIALKEKHHD